MQLINPNFVDHYRWGVNGKEKTDDPLYSKWCSALTEPYLKENMTILDYGCGCGRLANYISSKLENFTYYGLEPSWGMGPQGNECAKANYTEPRTHFGFIESNSNVISELEKEAIAKADLVVLGSILTHLPLTLGLVILNKFQSVLRKGGNISLSIFWGDEEILFNKLDVDWYGYTICSKSAIDKNLIYKKTGFIVAHGLTHHILSVKRINTDIKIL
jgi:SAM-dependent methyltransferase